MVFWKSVVLIASTWGAKCPQETAFALFENENEREGDILVTRMTYDKKFDLERLRLRKIQRSKTAVLEYPTIDLCAKLLSREDCAELIEDYKKMNKAFMNGVKFKLDAKNCSSKKWDALNILVSNKLVCMDVNWFTYKAICFFDVNKMINDFEKVLTVCKSRNIQEIKFAYRYKADYFEELTWIKNRSSKSAANNSARAK